MISPDRFLAEPLLTVANRRNARRSRKTIILCYTIASFGVALLLLGSKSWHHLIIQEQNIATLRALPAATVRTQPMHSMIRRRGSICHKLGTPKIVSRMSLGARLMRGVCATGVERGALIGVKVAAASEDSPVEPLDDTRNDAIMMEIRAMRAKAIKEELRERRISANDIFEKEELVQRLHDARVGKLTPAPVPAPAPSVSSVEDIMGSLKGMPGMEHVKIFTPDDLRGKSASEITEAVTNAKSTDTVSAPAPDAVGGANKTKGSAKAIYEAVDELRGMGMDGLKVLKPEDLQGKSASEIASRMGLPKLGEIPSGDTAAQTDAKDSSRADQEEPLSDQASFQQMMKETAAKARERGDEKAAQAAEEAAKLAEQLGEDGADIYADAFAETEKKEQDNRAPPKQVDMEEIKNMTAKAIKAELNERRIASTDCFEKGDLVDRLYSARAGLITPAPAPAP